MIRLLLCGVGLLLTVNVCALPLKVGTLNYAPPFSVATNGKNLFFGFDIDLMNEICARINQECVFVGMPFAALFENMSQGQLDLAIGAITVTGEREANFMFSLPYLDSMGQMLTKSDSAIAQSSDLRGKRIGAISGRQYRLILSAKFLNMIQVLEYPDVPTMLQALDAGKVDAVVMAQPMAKYWISTGTNQFKLIGEGFNLGMGMGIMSMKTNDGLIASVNQALLQMEADGTYLKLYNVYFGQLSFNSPLPISFMIA